MSRARLEGTHPEWQTDDFGEQRLYHVGAMRIIHSQRARKLRRRGETVVDSGERTRTGRAKFLWFVERLDQPRASDSKVRP